MRRECESALRRGGRFRRYAVGSATAALILVVRTVWAANPYVQFRPYVNYVVAGSEPKGAAVADFNLDGHLDLATACNGNSTDPVGEMGINLGNGTGNLGDDALFGTAPLRPWAVAAGDYDGDGVPDLAITDGQHYSSGVRIMLGDGFGEFTTHTTLTASAFPVGVVAGYFNDDTNLDLAAVGNVGTMLTVFHGDGQANFATVQNASVAMATGITAGDLNNDGRVDLIVSHYYGTSVFLNGGAGTFSYVGAAGGTYLTQAVDVGDINGDGLLDAASVELYADLLIARPGNGNGTFGAGQALPVGSWPYDVAVADLNRDGYADVVVPSMDTNRVRVYLGSASGLSPTTNDFATGSQPTIVVVGDFNEDGWPDVAACLRNFGDTAYASVLLQRALGDLNCDGVVNFDDINAFVLALSNPSAYHAAYPSCDILNGDVNGDGAVTFDDINAFVALLSG